MSAVRILITDGETRAMVAAARGLRSAGFAVGAAAARSARPAPAHWSRSVTDRFLVPHPLEDELAFVAAVETAVASGRYAVLMPGTDASLLALSTARDALAPHTLLGLPSHAVVERSMDKPTLASAASRHGLASPSTFECLGPAEALAAAQEIGFPVVVKPIRSVVEIDGIRRQVGSVRVGDDAALALAVRRLRDHCLIQRIEHGQVLSFAGVFVGGQFVGQAFSRYRRMWYPDAGNAAFSETLEAPPELRTRVAALLDELGWEGLFELELIERRDGEWSAIDFNPRAYGSMALAIGAGANLPAVWCAHLLGRHPAPVHARLGVFYRWEDADLRYVLWHVRRRQLRPAAEALRVRRRVVHAFFELRDPGPLVARLVFLVKATRDRAATPSRRAVEQDVRDMFVPPLLRRRRTTHRPLQVVVIGAGPYGLAAAAHLRAARVPVQCFGEPLEFWRRQMPEGMILRSPRRATQIADPNRLLTIDQYERALGKACRRPTLSLDQFIDYGRWFQQLGVPDLDQRKVTQVERAGGRFLVRLADGEQIEASRVVVATGLAPFGRRPEPFASLPDSLVSHASDHANLSAFAGKRVLVIGAGQSALESAALLGEHGATVEVVARSDAIRWLPDDTQPSNSARRVDLPLPPTGVGGRASGWLAATPDLLRRAPAPVQDWVSERCIAPAGSGWLRPRLAGVTISCGRFTIAAEAWNSSVRVRLDDGSERLVEHVLLGTGYKIDVTRYAFIEPELSARIETVGGYPRLASGLESSVAGLHFLGAPAAFSFGPVMRFVVGTWYAAPAVTLSVLGRRQRPLRFAF